MCPLSGPAPCSSPPDVHPFPHHWVSAKPSRKCLLYRTPGASRSRGVSPEGGGATSVPISGHPTARETMPTSPRRGRTSRRGHFLPGLISGAGERGEKGPPVVPPSARRPHKLPDGGVACPPACSLCPSSSSRFVPAPSGAHPGAAARGGQAERQRAHLSLSAAEEAAAAAALRNPGRMWRKLWLRSSLGWLLVRLMEPLRRRLRKPCARGDKKGKGRRG